MFLHRFGVWWRACAWLVAIAMSAAYATAAASTSSGSSMLSGWVYIDRNNDGQLAFDNEPDPEWIIAGMEVELYENTSAGETLMGVALTDEHGRYVFSGLAAGDYTLRQVQPFGFFDGLDTLGTLTTYQGQPVSGVDPGVVADDAFENIQITDNVMGNYYNFGERGLLPEYVSKRYLLGTAPPMVPAQSIPEPMARMLALLAIGGAWVLNHRRQQR